MVLKLLRRVLLTRSRQPLRRLAHHRHVQPLREHRARRMAFTQTPVQVLLGHCGELCTQSWQMQTRNLFIKLLWKQVDVPILQQVTLGKHLVGEGAGHDERGMAGSTARSKRNHHVPVREDEPIHLRLVVFHFDAPPGHVKLIVKVANVANDGVVFHLLHVLKSGDVEVARC